MLNWPKSYPRTSSFTFTTTFRISSQFSFTNNPCSDLFHFPISCCLASPWLIFSGTLAPVSRAAPCWRQRVFSEQFGADQCSHSYNPPPPPSQAQTLVILLISYKLLASALSFAELIAENFTNDCPGLLVTIGWSKARVFDLILAQPGLMTTFSLRLPQMRPDCEDKTGAQPQVLILSTLSTWLMTMYNGSPGHVAAVMWRYDGSSLLHSSLRPGVWAVGLSPLSRAL